LNLKDAGQNPVAWLMSLAAPEWHPARDRINSRVRELPKLLSLLHCWHPRASPVSLGCDLGAKSGRRTTSRNLRASLQVTS